MIVFYHYKWCFWPTTIEVDVCIYGGTAAGVMAAYTAQSGKSAIIIEPEKSGRHESGGLGYTDIGNKYAIPDLRATSTGA